MKHRIELQVNGRQREDWVDERLLLVYYLREVAGLTGTHVGCVVGECGACSVHINGSLVKSCLLLAVQVDGCDVRTIEGVEHGGELDPVQQSFVEEYGVQCGFCTPGMIMATHALLSKNPDPDEDDIRHALSGNICMCTGYVKIVDAVLTAARRMRR